MRRARDLFRSVFLLLIVFLFCASLSYAASSTDESVLGNDRWSVTSSGHLLPNADNSYDIGSSSYQANDIFYNGVLTPGTSSSQKVRYEVVATSDTVSATDSGKRFFATTTGTVLTLPAAALGLEYTFVTTDQKVLHIDPASTADTIEYLSLSAGDKITSPGTSADSVVLTCGAANTWHVTSMRGNWIDGN